MHACDAPHLHAGHRTPPDCAGTHRASDRTRFRHGMGRLSRPWARNKSGLQPGSRRSVSYASSCPNAAAFPCSRTAGDTDGGMRRWSHARRQRSEHARPAMNRRMSPRVPPFPRVCGATTPRLLSSVRTWASCRRLCQIRDGCARIGQRATRSRAATVRPANGGR